MSEVANALLVLANLAIFGFSLKLYTEILKEKSQRNRKGNAPQTDFMERVQAADTTDYGARRSTMTGMPLDMDLDDGPIISQIKPAGWQCPDCLCVYHDGNTCSGCGRPIQPKSVGGAS